MKILFVYDELRLDIPGFTGYTHEGLMTLSACCKAAGHQTDLLHITQPLSDDDFGSELKHRDFDAIGFSSVSATFPDVRRLIPVARRLYPTAPILYGGVHPALDPERSIEIPGVTAICRGEAEDALVELLDRLQSDGDISDVRNFWVRVGNNISRNSIRPLVTDLDTLPLPDFDLFDVPNLFSTREKTAPLTASRGCPYMCTYCSNHAQREQYSNKGEYVRFKSVSRTIAEAHQRLSKRSGSDIRFLDFTDDILPLRKQWFDEFAERYPKEVGVPFACNILIPLIDRHVVQQLKAAGCSFIVFGLESGSERIRRLLRRPRMSNEDVIYATRLIKDAGIFVASFNILGLPTETPAEMLETVKLNAQVGTQKTNAFHFQPYPHTEVHRLSVELGFYHPDQDLYNTWKVGPVLRNTGIPDELIIFLQRFFFPLVLLYRFGYWLSPRSDHWIDAAITRLVFPYPSRMARLTALWEYVYRAAKHVYVRFIMRFWSRRNRHH